MVLEVRVDAVDVEPVWRRGQWRSAGGVAQARRMLRWPGGARQGRSAGGTGRGWRITRLAPGHTEARDNNGMHSPVRPASGGQRPDFVCPGSDPRGRREAQPPIAGGPWRRGVLAGKQTRLRSTSGRNCCGEHNRGRVFSGRVDVGTTAHIRRRAMRRCSKRSSVLPQIRARLQGAQRPWRAPFADRMRASRHGKQTERSPASASFT